MGLWLCGFAVLFSVGTAVNVDVNCVLVCLLCVLVSFCARVCWLL